MNTQKIALNALVLMYHKVLKAPLGGLGFSLAAKKQRLPTVLTPDEAQKIINQLHVRDQTIVSILYGSGLRISECLRLRVQDVDLTHLSINVINGKSRKDRQTLLSQQLVKPLEKLIAEGVALQQQDRLENIGTSLPYQLGRKYKYVCYSPA